jgi:hypothetical protein
MYNCMKWLHPIYVLINSLKGKAIPVQAYYRPRGFQEVEAPIFQDSWHPINQLPLPPKEIFLELIFVRG